MGSLQGRLLAAATAMLVTFLGITGVGLDRAFQQSALGAVRDRLQAQIYLLLGAAEVDEHAELSVPPLLPEARFSTPNSGLYAEIADAAGKSVWRSPSMLDRQVPFPAAQFPGQPVFAEVLDSSGGRLFTLSFAVIWEVGEAVTQRYTFRVAEARETFAAQVQSFRHNLGGWFAVSAIALSAVQILVLRWSLAPLRQVARELAEIEEGARCELTTVYPREIQQLTGKLNGLIRHSREHLQRSRNALGNLAHSLKTPLAVLRATMETTSQLTHLQRTVAEQVDRMSQLVEYQLQCAAASGRTTMATPLLVEPVVKKIMTSLSKAYHSKGVVWSAEVPSSSRFHGDQSDFMEVMGNLIDNAFKWSRSQIIVRAFPSQETGSTQTGLVIEVEDDGPGIPSSKLTSVLRRGIRADPATAGHGIGLAVIREIVEEIYQGAITIERGSLGGARIRIEFPKWP